MSPAHAHPKRRKRVAVIVAALVTAGGIADIIVVKMNGVMGRLAGGGGSGIARPARSGHAGS